MPLTPQWRNTRQTKMTFVGRQTELQLLSDALVDQQMADTYRVVSVFGVGGQGKSSLLQAFQKQLTDAAPPVPYALVDFALFENRDPKTALLRIRNQLVSFGLRSNVFDVAFARLFALTRHRRTLKQDFPEFFGSHMGICGDVADIALTLGTELPGGKLILEALSKLPEIYKEWYWKNEPVLQELDALSQQELADRLPTYLGYDIAAFIEKDPPSRPVLLFDTYEALWHERAGIQTGPGATSVDEWVRHFVEECPGVLFVISGRRKLGWAQFDADWKNSIIECPVADLSSEEQDSFLKQRGILERTLRVLMIRNARGHALTLNLQAYYYNKILQARRVPEPRDFPPTHREILDRFVGHLEPSFAALLRVAALTDELSPDLWMFLSSKLPMFTLHTISSVVDGLLFREDERGRFVMHDVLCDHLVEDYETNDGASARLSRSVIFSFFDNASSADEATRSNVCNAGKGMSVDQRDRYFLEAAHQLQSFDPHRFPEWCLDKLISYRLSNEGSKVSYDLLRQALDAHGVVPSTSSGYRASLANLKLFRNPFSRSGLDAAEEVLEEMEARPQMELVNPLIGIAVSLAVARSTELLGRAHGALKKSIPQNDISSVIQRIGISNQLGDTAESSRLLQMYFDEGKGKGLWSWEILTAVFDEPNDISLPRYLTQLGSESVEVRYECLPFVVEALSSSKHSGRLPLVLTHLYQVDSTMDLMTAFASTSPVRVLTEYILWNLCDCLTSAGSRDEARQLLASQIPLQRLTDCISKAELSLTSAEPDAISRLLNEHTDLKMAPSTWGHVLRCLLSATTEDDEQFGTKEARSTLQDLSAKLLTRGPGVRVSIGDTVFQPAKEASYPCTIELVVNDRGVPFVFTSDPTLCWKQDDFAAVAGNKLFLYDYRLGLTSFPNDLDPKWRTHLVPGFTIMLVYMHPETGEPILGRHKSLYDWDDAVVENQEIN